MLLGSRNSATQPGEVSLLVVPFLAGQLARFVLSLLAQYPCSSCHYLVRAVARDRAYACSGPLPLACGASEEKMVTGGEVG